MKGISKALAATTAVLLGAAVAYATVTASNLSTSVPAVIPAYASGGSLTHTEFNAITQEIVNTQKHVLKNYNLLGFVNVLDYATGVETNPSSSVTISSTVVNAAIAASGPRNVIYIPANVMVNCDAGSIILTSGKHLLGGGIIGTASLGGPAYAQPNVTTVYSTNGNDLVRCTGTSSGGNGIAGIFFGDYQHYAVGIRLDSGDGTWLNDGWIKDCWFARASIYASNVQGWGLSRCIFDWTSGPALEMYGCENWRVEGNYFCLLGQGANNTGGVVVGSYSGNGRKSISHFISGNHFTAGGLQGTGYTSHGLIIDGAQAVSVTGNHFAQNTGRGVWIKGGATNITLSGNQYEKNGSESIYIDGSSKVIITGSSFNSVRRLISGTGVYPTEQNVPHIRTVNTCSRILMTALTLDSDTRTTGIELSSGTTKSRWDNLITDGTVTTAVTDLNGTNSAGTVVN